MTGPRGLTPLIAIGYWKVLADDKGIFPQELPTHDYSADILERISRFFGQARKVEFYLGLSWCRFRCGIANREMGCADCSDGDYIWPQGYPHYILSHRVALPELFLERILASDGRCPDAFEVVARRAGRPLPIGPTGDPYMGPVVREDHSFWTAWCRERSNGDKSFTEGLRRHETERAERQAREHRKWLVGKYGEDPSRTCVFAGCGNHPLVGKSVCWRHHG